jgi:hypothetical protein
MVFAETLLEVTHCVAFSHALGITKTLQLVHNRAFGTMQALCDSCRGNAPDEFLKKIHLAGCPRPAIHMQGEPQPSGLTFDVPAREASQLNHSVEYLKSAMPK